MDALSSSALREDVADPHSPALRIFDRPISAARLFILVAPLVYAAYALITPPFQTFDESQHLFRAWQISSLQFVAERRGRQSGGELPPGLAQAAYKELASLVPQSKRQTLIRPISQIFGINTPIGNNRAAVYVDFYGAVVYPPIGYAPQVVAVWIGSGADLSVEWTLRLGRLLNALLCIALVGWALTLVPFGRWPMAAIALSPPMAAGAASFGQDALVNGGGFLLIALGLRIAADARWTGARSLAVAIAGTAVSLAKFVYLPLIALAAFPIPKRDSARTWLLPPLLIGSAVVALLYMWMRINASAVVVPFRTWVPRPAEQVSWALTHPADFALLVGRTWRYWLPTAWIRIYTFGDSTVPPIVSAAVAGTAGLVAIMFHGDEAAVALRRARRTWMLLLFAAMTFLITVVMFVTLAPRGAVIIEGMQGRYLLPVLPLAVIGLIPSKTARSAVLLRAGLTLILAAHMLTLAVLLTTFYSF